jgi:Tfp pilus assembly protein PilX
MGKKGIALFLVLFVVLIVVVLANVVLGFISIQSRLTHHQVSRIQAYYAAQAGVNYALEMLRLGTWSPGNSYNLPADADFPHTIQSVSITIDSNPTGPGGTYPVHITVDYTQS